ncbi:MAG TPA: DUF72 domain-containing protein [Candidatus Eisenbacteria bacterium]|nr:DUF72 domain-containing protein [Candidatus Eisenbacteria bacterium]
MAERSQLDLFGGAPPRTPRPGPIGPAPIDPELVDLARRLPEQLYLGTSSWSFPGWRGLVYDREVTAPTLARHGLAAYAQHPLLRTVGLDRTFYAPMTREALEDLARQVPAAFRFLVKALETSTLAVFPRHERYGSQAGRPNPAFLDAEQVAAALLRPLVAGLATALGPIVFQLPPQPPANLGGPARFAMRLRAFLRGLPAGPTYAVELRNRELLSADVASALADTGAVPCLTVHPTMPPLGEQARQLGSDHAPTLVVRWMLGAGQEYEAARERYRPFDRVVDPDPATREAIGAQCRSALAAGRRAFVVVNNKAEGSAPASIVLLARTLAAG